MYGRRYSEGLHQAIEAKENVQVQRESLTLATITFQNYFRMYRRLAGMTGTAEYRGAKSLARSIACEVMVIPTHKPMIREDQRDVVYKTEDAKFRAVIDEIKERHKTAAAGAGGHRGHREVGDASPAPAPQGHQPRGAQCQVPRA